MGWRPLHPFEEALSVPAEDLEIELRGFQPVPWAPFLLNPRRLRGSDFLMRWSQGVWSEHRIIEAVAETGRYFALPYGPSGTAPDDDVQAFEKYFEELEQAGLGQIKRPDLLIFRRRDAAQVTGLVEAMEGVARLPFTAEGAPLMRKLLRYAVLAVECETSLWVGRQMPDYGAELKPQRRLGGLDGLRKGAVLPTIIIKEEDRGPLRDWQHKHGVEIHIWHVFYDVAYGISLDGADELIECGRILPTRQVFQAPGGATTQKVTYRIYHHYAYAVGEGLDEPQLVAAHIQDKNGHILPYVRFEGGTLDVAAAGVPK